MRHLPGPARGTIAAGEDRVRLPRSDPDFSSAGTFATALVAVASEKFAGGTLVVLEEGRYVVVVTRRVVVVTGLAREGFDEV
jgi:hypothetical protein